MTVYVSLTGCQVTRCFRCGVTENVCEQCAYGYKLFTSEQGNTSCLRDCPEGYEAAFERQPLARVCQRPEPGIAKQNKTGMHQKKGCCFERFKHGIALSCTQCWLLSSISSLIYLLLLLFITNLYIIFATYEIQA